MASCRRSDLAPDDAQVWYDVAVSYDPRFIATVCRETYSIADQGQGTSEAGLGVPCPRADYTNSEYRERRKERIAMDGGLCVICSLPDRV